MTCVPYTLCWDGRCSPSPCLHMLQPAALALDSANAWPQCPRGTASLQPHFSNIYALHILPWSATVRFIKVIIGSDLSSHGSVSIRVGVETNCRRSEAVRASPHRCIFIAALSIMSHMDLMLGPGTGILSMKMAISLQMCPLPPFKGCMRWSC